MPTQRDRHWRHAFGSIEPELRSDPRDNLMLRDRRDREIHPRGTQTGVLMVLLSELEVETVAGL